MIDMTGRKTFSTVSDIQIIRMSILMEHAIISFSDSEIQRPELPFDMKYNKGVLRINLSRINMLSQNNEHFLYQTAEHILNFVEDVKYVDWFVIHSTNSYFRGPTTAAALSFIYNGPGSEKKWLVNQEFSIDHRFFSAFIGAAITKELI